MNNLGNGPNDVLVDFERCAINALQNREIEAKGCFFHLCSNIWKHVQNLGLAQRYNHEEEFTLHLRMISALAFLPPEDVIDGFEELSDTIRELYNDTVDGLLQYFEDTYIGRFRRNAPRPHHCFPSTCVTCFTEPITSYPVLITAWRVGTGVSRYIYHLATLCFGDFCRFSKMKKTWYEYQLYNNSLDTQIHHPTPRLFIPCFVVLILTLLLFVCTHHNVAIVCMHSS